jgi:Ca2+-binding RTX toxin-like protein
MTVSMQDYAMLSSAIYNDISVNQTFSNGSSTYKVVFAGQALDGYRGAVFVNEATGEVVVSNGGTQLSDVHDIISDLAMGPGSPPPQLVDAANLTRWAQQYATENDLGEVTATGHSLGGALAQLLAAEFGIRAETFNAYGAYDIAVKLGLNPSAAMDLVTNHRDAFDPVSSLSDHIGSSSMYMSEGEYNDLSAYGVEGALKRAWDTLGAHSISNFWDNDNLGKLFEHNYLSDLNSPTILDDIKNLMGELKSLLEKIGDALYNNIFGGMDASIAALANIINSDSSYRIVRYDPLALDLDGDGIVGTHADTNWDGPLFDNDGDGIRTATGWIGANDGLLVRDIDGNGLIDSGRELFGDQTLLADGTTARSGFAALAAMDSNGDGQVDALDAEFSTIRVWRDANGNGTTEAGELLTLSELGIVSLSVIPSSSTSTTVDGGTLVGSGSYTRVAEDGTLSTAVMQEFDFDNDSLHSAYAETVEIPEALLGLANLKGMGKLRDLREACALSPALAQSVQSYTSAATRDQQRALLPEILLEWAKTSPTFHVGNIELHGGGGVSDPNSGNVIYLRPGEVLPWPEPTSLDAETTLKIRVVEALLGSEPITDIWWGSTNVSNYLNIYNTFFEGVYASLSVQTRLKGYLELIDFGWADGTSTMALNFGRLDEALAAKHASNPEAALVDLAELLKFKGQVFVEGGWTGGEDLLRSWLTDAQGDPALRDRLAAAGILLGAAVIGGSAETVGTASVDVLVSRGTLSTDREALRGGGGDDTLLGGMGSDVLSGDAGNDILSGGDGADTLDGGQGNDRLYGGLGSDNLSGGDGDDELFGDEGNDSLMGGAGRDVLHGGEGNDSLQGGDGDDLLDGGAGNDYMAGNAGNDIYAFGRKSGHDTINNYDNVAGRKDVLQMATGIAPSDLKVWRSGDDLCLQINGTEDRIDIQYYFRNDGYSDYRLDEIRFADGTTWNIEAVKAIVLVAGNGNDDIYGYETDDVIVGSADNDWLVGRGGNDTISGGAGADSLSGDDGSDTLSGDDGNDSLSGGAGDDMLDGGTGDDRLAGGDGNDRLTGGTGNDYLTGDAGNDTYVFARGDGRDTIYNYDTGVGRVDSLEFAAGIAASDVVATRVGDDLSLQINGSDDRVYVQQYFRDEGAGAFRLDAIRFADGTVWNVDAVKALVQVGTDGNDILTGYVGDDVLSGGLGDDTLTGGAGNDTLSGGAGADFLDGGDGADTLSGDDGNDTLLGGAGNDHLMGGAGVDALYGGDGNDVLEGGGDRDWLSGEAGDDSLSGGDGDDEIYGGAGTDTLTGGLGDDRLFGGQGDDRYVFTRGDGKDRIVDAEGLSTIALAGLTASDVRMRRDGADLVIRFDSSLGDEIRFEQFFNAVTDLATMALSIDSGTLWNLSREDVDAQVLLGTTADDVIFGNIQVNTINGLAGNDVIRAGDGDDIVDGGDGNDQLYGEGGNDHLIGGAGDDTLEGGDGIDVLAGGVGNDTLSGNDGDDTLDGEDGADRLMGGAGNDVLRGGAGNDLLDGGSDQDQMIGGSGDDTYIVDNVNDVVIEAFNEGVDTIQSGVSYTLSTNVEHLELLGSASIDGVGNALANELTGNNGANRLEGLDGDDVLLGMGGNDTLIGGAGDDRLDGGAGVDQMIGGAGNDTYVVDSFDDIIVELAGEGTDVVYASSSYALSDNLEKLVLVEGAWASEGTGNAGDNILMGNSSGNRLDGGAGADIMTGGLGDDTYVVDQVGDQVIELEGEGNDTVESSINYVLGSTLENLTLIDSGNINGTGNDKDNILIGNAGNNRLEGGLGADKLYGGLGDDYYIEESSADWVYEYADEGLDTVERRFETNLVLKNHVENLILASGIQTGNGNGLDNQITGNAGDNKLAGLDGDDVLIGLDGNDSMWGGNGEDRLYGGAGDDYLDGEAGVDYLEGGAGNDVYIVDDANDIVVEAANGGTDQVQTTASYVLSDNIENLFLMGSDDLDGTGNALDNYLAGNDGDNVFNGMAGNDTIVAGKGNDTLIGGTGDDKYVFDADSGSDVIDNADGGFDGVFFTNGITRESLSFGRDGDDLLIFVDGDSTPAVRVLNHFLGGNAAIDYVQPDGGYYLTTAEINQIVAGGGTGGQYDQVIEGTAAGEQLVGSAGKDLIKGLAGDDTLFGMAGNDTLQGGDGDDYLAGGNGGGTGSGDDRLEGGAGNDTLAGEDGNDTLIGGTGDDQYVYGGGQDIIDNTGGGYDGLFFNDGITASQLGFTREGDDLLIKVSGDASKTVRVLNHFLGGDSAIDYVQPATGSMLDTAAINALVGGSSGGTPPGEPGNDADYTKTITGTASGEQLVGTSGRDLIRGLAGNDTLFGMGGDDKLVGGDGDDYLSGGNGSFSGSGNDILVGGAGVDTLVGEDGNDLLQGGTGDDNYIWQTGSGKDVIDNTGGGTDWLFFNGIVRTRLSFHRSADDLVILVDGDSNQQVRVQDHFKGGDLAISYVQPSDGYAIPASQFGSLLTPLPAGFTAASFSPSSMSVMSLAPDTQAMAFGMADAANSVTGSTSSDVLSDKRGRLHAALWDWPSEQGSGGRVSPIRGMDGDTRFGHGVSVSREAQQLIEAMSRFSPVSGTSEAHEDIAWSGATLTMSHVTDHPFKERSRVSVL